MTDTLEKTTQEKPVPIRTNRLLPFLSIPPDSFELLLFWIVEKNNEFDAVQHSGSVGDKRRDVIGNKHLKNGSVEKWYFSAKRYQEFSSSHVKKELDLLLEHSQKTPGFKPDTIVFGVACNTSAATQDYATEYGQQLGFNHVYVWPDTVMDAKTRMTPGAVENFFYTDNQAVAKAILEELKKESPQNEIRLTIPSQSPIISTPEVLKEKTDLLNKRIDKTVELLNTGNFTDARQILLEICGEINGQNEFAKEQARVNNNLGVTFNQSEPDGDFDKAIHYFLSALKNDPSLSKATMNLASAYLNRNRPDDLKEAGKLINGLWQTIKTPENLQVLLWSIYKTGGAVDVIEFLHKEEKDTAEIIKKSSSILNFIAGIYLELQQFDEALSSANKAIDIEPEEPEPYSTKAKVLIMRAQNNNTVPSEFQIIPKFKDYQDIQEATELFDKAEKLAIEKNRKHLLQEIHYGIAATSVWLGRYEEATQKLNLLKGEQLTEEREQQVEIITFAKQLENREFELAYNTLKESHGYKKTKYEEKIRLAKILLLRGGLEQSKLIFQEVLTEAEDRKDVYYWLDLSMVNALLENKEEAISAVNQAKKYIETEDIKKEDQQNVYSHYNALILRYTKSFGGKGSETGRLLPALFEYQKKFPELEVIKPIQALDSDGDLTEEMKRFLTEKKNWYDNLKIIFKEQPIPSYYLEKVLNRSYADIVVNRGDFDFTFEFTVPNKEFNEEIDNNLLEANGLIFDYLTLLDLAKAKLLGFLERMGKPLYIHEELFSKIQEEYLKNNIEELGYLYNFLRKSRAIKFLQSEPNADLELEKLFDNWLVGTIKLAESKKLVLATDDLRLLRFVKSKNIKSFNIMALLRQWLEKGYIDNKVYSLTLGCLAEKFFTFISFNGDDLFEIVMEDSAEITQRSYHLINQIFLPGSQIETFTKVFVQFIHKLWNSGSLPDEKIKWVKLLTEIIVKLINKLGIPPKDTEQFGILIEHLGALWGSALKVGTKDDLKSLLKIPDEIFKSILFVNTKEVIIKRIQQRIDELKGS